MSADNKDISKKSFKIYLIPILIALGIVIVFLFYTSMTYPVQRFSAIGVLDGSGGTTSYTKSAPVNTTLNYTVSVVNQEDMTLYYRVIIKYGNESTINSLLHPSKNVSTELTHFDVILPNDLLVFHKISFQIPKVQNNTKIIFELWKYVPLVHQFIYSGMWNHLWVNITT
ncbi:MAG: hypothetical protein ACTSRG_05715 [Candidatus Helarchaeota archaeon]